MLGYASRLLVLVIMSAGCGSVSFDGSACLFVLSVVLLGERENERNPNGDIRMGISNNNRGRTIETEHEIGMVFFFCAGPRVAYGVNTTPSLCNGLVLLVDSRLCIFFHICLSTQANNHEIGFVFDWCAHESLSQVFTLVVATPVRDCFARGSSVGSDASGLSFSLIL